MGNNAPIPINDSSRCKTCGQVISSDCVAWAGPAVKGTCKGATATDIIMSIINGRSGVGCCPTDIYNTGGGCVTGSWVDFSSSIISGSGSGYTYSIASIGSGIIGSPSGNPSYKWTAAGDLLFKGFFTIDIILSAPGISGAAIDIGNIPISCFPINWSASTSKLIETTNTNAENFSTAYLQVEYSTGKIQLVVLWDYSTPGGTLLRIALGGTQFNLD